MDSDSGNYDTEKKIGAAHGEEVVDNTHNPDTGLSETEIVAHVSVIAFGISSH